MSLHCRQNPASPSANFASGAVCAVSGQGPLTPVLVCCSLWPGEALRCNSSALGTYTHRGGPFPRGHPLRPWRCSSIANDEVRHIAQHIAASLSPQSRVTKGTTTDDESKWLKYQDRIKRNAGQPGRPLSGWSCPRIVALASSGCRGAVPTQRH